MHHVCPQDTISLNMSLHVAPLTEGDIGDYVAIRHAAFEGSVNKIFYNRTVSEESKSSIAAYNLKLMRENPTLKYLKATDSSTGQIIACAKWEVLPRARSDEEVEAGLGAPVTVPECNLPCWNAFFTMLNETRRELMGGRPCYGNF
jgi:hypothetical protein